MNINDKYKDLWQLKEDTYKVIDFNMPIIIYMDGKHITSNHKDYNMLKTPNFTNDLIDSAEKTCKKLHLSADLYAGIDELAIIIREPHILKEFDVGDNANYINLIFMQHFLKFFWKTHPEVIFKSTIFNISNENIPRYIEYRREICYSGALWYIAKEYLSKEEYKELSVVTDMEKLLKDKNLWTYFDENKQLRSGILKSVSPLDSIIASRFL